MEPAVTVAVVEVNVGPVVDPDAEFTSNWYELEFAPPGPGVITVMAMVLPAVAMSIADICVVNWVALTYVVVGKDVPHIIIEPVVNPVPLTVSVKAALPALI